MIGVSSKPSSSSAARISPTRPSIMSLGAIRSAPARAWETAVRASSSSVASLSTPPSDRSTPQCPWLVYSHRHRSVMTRSSGWASLMARVASWTMPSSSQAPEPSSSLAAGSPNRSTAGDAQGLGLAGLGHRMGDREPVDAGHGLDRLAAIEPVGDEHRVDEVRRIEAGLADQAAERAGGPEPAQAGLRERHNGHSSIPAPGRAAGDAGTPSDQLPALDPPGGDQPGAAGRGPRPRRPRRARGRRP